MSGRVKAVILGGLLSGILGVFLALLQSGLMSVHPAFRFIQYICCIPAILGGAVAAVVHIKSSKVGLSKGQGAITGVISGVVMFLGLLLIAFPGQILIAVIRFDGFENYLLMLRYSATSMIIHFVIQLVLAVVFCFGFGGLGGLLGTVILEKRQPGQETPAA